MLSAAAMGEMARRKSLDHCEPHDFEAERRPDVMKEGQTDRMSRRHSGIRNSTAQKTNLSTMALPFLMGSSTLMLNKSHSGKLYGTSSYVSNSMSSTHRQNKSQATSQTTREPSRKSPRKDKANISYEIVNEVSC